jgi:hypothetical protein
LRGFSKETCLVLPLTTSRFKNKYRTSIGLIADKKAKVILSQMKVIDTKRLINRIAVLDKRIFESIRKSIRDLL